LSYDDVFLLDVTGRIANPRGPDMARVPDVVHYWCSVNSLRLMGINDIMVVALWLVILQNGPIKVSE